MKPAVVLMLGLGTTIFAQETVELENRWVKVTRLKLTPGQSLAPREFLPGVAVFLTDARLSVGAAQPVVHQYKDVVAFDGGARQAVQNAGDQPVELVITELKPERISAAKVSLDPVKLDPKYHTVPIENDRVRVLRTVLEPGIKSPLHEHPAYVVVYETELHTTQKLPDGRLVDNPRKKGDIAWRDYTKHETQNIGKETAEEIQIELK